MKIYNYNKETKEFTTQSTATANPLEKGKYLIPASATTKEPLTLKDSFAICFNEEKQEWEYVEDNRNTVVYNKQTKQESKIDYLGKIKDDVTTLKPEQFDKWDYDNNVWILDLVAKEKYALEIKIIEAKQYLEKTDHKFYNGYKPKEGEDLVEIERLRDEAREFIRTNEGDE